MRLCSLDGCELRHKAKGLCGIHYKRVWRGRDVAKRIREDRNGRTFRPEYSVWRSMNARCNPRNANEYPNHAGKGIKVCSRWSESFNDFHTDMGDRPSSAHSIDRINNEGNYEPGNCRWATQLEQSLNKSIRSDNTTGVVGVYYVPSTGRWNAQIIRHSKMMYHKYFATKEEATIARAEQVSLIDKELL